MALSLHISFTFPLQVEHSVLQIKAILRYIESAGIVSRVEIRYSSWPLCQWKFVRVLRGEFATVRQQSHYREIHEIFILKLIWSSEFIRPVQITPMHMYASSKWKQWFQHFRYFIVKFAMNRLSLLGRRWLSIQNCVTWAGNSLNCFFENKADAKKTESY